MIVIITCGKQKLRTNTPVPLAQLYNSRLGQGKIQLARKITTDDKIYILSGVLGLVPLQSTSSWYDSQNKLPNRTLLKSQVAKYDLQDNILFIGQKLYFNVLVKFYPNLQNLIPISKGSGDFTRRVYELIRQIEFIAPIEEVGIEEKNRGLERFFI